MCMDMKSNDKPADSREEILITCNSLSNLESCKKVCDGPCIIYIEKGDGDADNRPSQKRTGRIVSDSI